HHVAGAGSKQVMRSDAFMLNPLRAYREKLLISCTGMVGGIQARRRFDLQRRGATLPMNILGPNKGIIFTLT
ncbi:MAG: hypothetical protein ACREIR_20740, partial [Geminicoccaceae bacterium]